MHWIDWLIVLFPAVVVAIIGVKTQRYVRSVAHFMAAGRAAGRYLLTTSEMMAGTGLISVVANFEFNYRSGFAVDHWWRIQTPIVLFISLSGYLIYRYRETRAFTLAQFFEMRYSRGVRVFTGILGAISGILNYAFFPAVGGRFFVYYCDLPPTIHLLGLSISTFGLVMFSFLSVALLMVLAGGQLTILVTDCVQGLFSYIMFLIVGAALLLLFSYSQLEQAMVKRPPGQSLVNPFDIGGYPQDDFSIWFVMIGLFGLIYGQMAWQGNQGYNASAANPHEARMGRVLGQWRYGTFSMMYFMLACGAYAFMHLAEFAPAAAVVNASLSAIPNEAVRTQMTVPMVLAHILPIGIKGMFCALMLFLMVTTDVSYLHSWGSIVIQDVILPFRKRAFTPRQQINLLRLSITAVAVIAFFFSLYYEPKQYILMFMALTGSIYVGGAGACIIGGMYWKKGTAAGAWAAMILSAAIGTAGILGDQFWPAIDRWLLGFFPQSRYLLDHAAKFPVNGQWTWFIAMMAAIVGYILVSLLSRREDFNLDRMLHRGKYAVDEQGHPLPTVERPRFSWKSLIGVDDEMPRGDRRIAVAVFAWTTFWFLAWLGVTLWNLVPGLRWKDDRMWFGWVTTYYMIGPMLIGLVTVVWFTLGGIRDLRRLFKTLNEERPDISDDGRVVSPLAPGSGFPVVVQPEERNDEHVSIER